MRGTSILIAVLFGFVAVGPLSGAVAQESVTTPAAEEDAPIEGMFDIGGRSLYLSCLGTGSPTVILEAGADTDSSYWAGFQQRVAEMTRVCRYDRAGQGRSVSAREASPSVGSLAVDLRSLLDAAAVPGPYVLVGHSCGGLVVRQFASSNPDDVAGLVLIDSCNPGWLPEAEAELPPDLRASLAGANPEGVDYVAGSRDVQDIPLPDVPAIVVANWEGDDEWLGWQAAMAQELDTVLIVVPGAGHEIHLTRPEPVLDAIREVLTAAQGGLATPAP